MQVLRNVLVKTMVKKVISGAPLLAMILAAAFWWGYSAAAQTSTPGTASPPSVPLKLNIDLSKLPKTPPEKFVIHPRGKLLAQPAAPSHPPTGPDPLWKQGSASPGAAAGTVLAGADSGVSPSQFTTPNPNFAGMSGGGFPPDTNGAPGPNHYIQTINVSFEIWDKQGNSLAGPTAIQQLWNNAGAPSTNQCTTGFYSSDPYVQYDQLADRWVMSFLASQDTSGALSHIHFMCFAVSQGPNPVTDGWFLYNFDVVQPDDYPKFAVWPDGYYLITQEGYNGGNLDARVFDRANMLNGNPATFQTKSFLNGGTVIALPSEMSGPNPPGGSPNFYVRPFDGNLYGSGQPRIEIFEFHTDWGNPANSTFSLVQTIIPATFSSDCIGTGTPTLDQDCIPQPGTAQLLDGQTTWPRSPLQYRNFGDHESMVFAHGVNVNGGSPGLEGTRWYELRRTPPGSGSWVLQQQGTFEPTDAPNSSTTTIRRWNASIAMDQAGNIALGYNVSNDGSNGNVFPGIRYVGRLATDPAGEMTTPEVTLATGTGVINGGDRWGDYSMIRVDPVDGCTFWFTSEFITNGQSSQIGAFRFPTCNPADLAITKTASASSVAAGGQLTYTIAVTNNGPSNATNVIVTDTLPTGVTFVSTSAVCNSGTVTTGCNIGSLASGASVSFTIQVHVNSNAASAGTTTLVNTATVTGDQLDPDLSNNTASVSTTVVESADLQVTKVCKPDLPAVAGTNAFCDITVSDLGPSDARSVVLNDAIVSNTLFTVVSATGGPCSFSTGPTTTNNVVCNLGTLTASSSVTIHVVFSANNAGDVNDTATVSSPTPDPNTANNSATGHVSFAASADLSITKTAAANSASCPFCAGTTVTYTISVSNAGPSNAAGVVVKDTIPAQESVLSVTPSAGSCTAGIPGNPLQPLTCTIGNLGAPGTASVVVVAAIASNAPNGTIVNNNATVSSSAADPNIGNNSATAAVTVPAKVDLAIVKTSDQSVYKPSSVITYTITVTNNGPSDALAVAVTDNLPTTAQAIYQSDTGGCTKSGLTLTCNLGNMPVGTSKSFNVYELVKGSRGQVSNTASVTSSTTELNPANNTSTRIVTIGH